MLPTRRLVALAFLAASVSVVAGYVHELRSALFVLDGLLVVGVALDAILGRKSRVQVERQVAGVFSVGRANPIVLHLRNRSSRSIRGVVADDPLESCEALGNPADFELAANGTTSIRYQVMPATRGRRTLGAVTVRYPCPLGLIARQERSTLRADIDVYPDVHAARALELLRRQGRQDARLGSLRVRGGDTEFERLRPYQVGDEVRHVDWRASARRDDLVIRQQQTESNQNVIFAIDVGRGMRGQSGGLTAVDQALNAALLAADVALRGGDKAGLIAFDAVLRRFVPPTGGLRGAHRLTRAVYDIEAGFEATDYRAAFGFLRARVRTRSLFVLFTKLLDPRSAGELTSSMMSLLPRHLPLCVLLRDTDVEDLTNADAGVRDSLYVRAAAAEVLADRDALLRSLRKAGVLVLDARPRDLTPDLVKSYLDVKTRHLL